LPPGTGLNCAQTQKQPDFRVKPRAEASDKNISKLPHRTSDLVHNLYIGRTPFKEAADFFIFKHHLRKSLTHGLEEGRNMRKVEPSVKVLIKNHPNLA
jgi:hypothetical protein